LVTETRERSKSKGPKIRGKNRGKSNKFADVECYNCGMTGHIRKHCKKIEERK
jgi:hypothetical protein